MPEVVDGVCWTVATRGQSSQSGQMSLFESQWTADRVGFFCTCRLQIYLTRSNSLCPTSLPRTAPLIDISALLTPPWHSATCGTTPTNQGSWPIRTVCTTVRHSQKQSLICQERQSENLKCSTTICQPRPRMGPSPRTPAIPILRLRPPGPHLTLISFSTQFRFSKKNMPGTTHRWLRVVDRMCTIHDAC